MPLLLGSHYFEKYLEDMYSRKRKGVPANYSEIQIISRLSIRKQKMGPSRLFGDSTNKVQVSTQVRVAKDTTNDTGSQTFLQYKLKGSGLVLV